MVVDHSSRLCHLCRHGNHGHDGYDGLQYYFRRQRPEQSDHGRNMAFLFGLTSHLLAYFRFQH